MSEVYPLVTNDPSNFKIELRALRSIHNSRRMGWYTVKSDAHRQELLDMVDVSNRTGRLFIGFVPACYLPRWYVLLYNTHKVTRHTVAEVIKSILNGCGTPMMAAQRGRLFGYNDKEVEWYCNHLQQCQRRFASTPVADLRLNGLE